MNVSSIPAHPTIEVLATGLGHPEGPDVQPDGRVLFVNTYRGEICSWDSETGLSTFVHTGGAPNACLRGADGNVYATMHPFVAEWVPSDARPGSIVRVTPDGQVETHCARVGGRTLNAPNDLTFAADGRLYFTDSGQFDLDSPEPGCVFAVDRDGRGEIVVDTGPVYPNGIAAEADGSVVWVESYTRMVRRLMPDGQVSDLCQLPEGHVPDGLKISTTGDLWITGIFAGGLDVVAPDGTYLGFVETGGLPLNCVFGSDGWLYVCDSGGDAAGEIKRGRLVRAQVGASGMPLFRGWEVG